MYSTLQQLLGELLQRRSFRDHPSSSFLETKSKYDDGSHVEWQIWIKNYLKLWMNVLVRYGELLDCYLH